MDFRMQVSDAISMEHAPEHLRTYLRELLLQHNIDATSLAREIGRSKDYIRDFIEGRKQSISYQSLMAIEKKFSIKPDPIVLDYIVEKSEEETFAYKRRSEFAMRDIIGIFATQDRDATIGMISIGTLSIETVARPYFLPKVGAPYGIIIDAETMSPIYEIGDTVFLNPALGIRRNSDVLILSEDDQGKIAELSWSRAILGHLEDYDSDQLQVRTQKPDRVLTLDRTEWPRVDRVVARCLRR